MTRPGQLLDDNLPRFPSGTSLLQPMMKLIRDCQPIRTLKRRKGKVFMCISAIGKNVQKLNQLSARRISVEGLANFCPPFPLANMRIKLYITASGTPRRMLYLRLAVQEERCSTNICSNNSSVRRHRYGRYGFCCTTFQPKLIFAVENNKLTALFYITSQIITRLRHLTILP